MLKRLKYSQWLSRNRDLYDTLPHKINCPECDGAKEFTCNFCNGDYKTLCPDCQGDGSITSKMGHEYDCEHCDGDGYTYCKFCDHGYRNCSECSGKGYLNQDDQIDLIYQQESDLDYDREKILEKTL